MDRIHRIGFIVIYFQILLGVLRFELENNLRDRIAFAIIINITGGWRGGVQAGGDKFWK
jgi:hypothetical protein